MAPTVAQTDHGDQFASIMSSHIIERSTNMALCETRES